MSKLTEQLEAQKPRRKDRRPAGALSVAVRFEFPRPKSVPGKSRWKKTKPDIDNLLKLVLDQLEKTGWIENDSRVATVIGKKVYVGATGVPGATIWITDRLP